MSVNLPLIYSFPSLLDRFFMDQAGVSSLPVPQKIDARHFPPLQIFEDDDTLYLRASVPGISRENLCLALTPKTLSLWGVIPFLTGKHLRGDRPIGPFRRDVTLPCPVEPDAVQAVLRNGILTVTLPKTPLAEKRAIPINSKNPGPP